MDRMNRIKAKGKRQRVKGQEAVPHADVFIVAFSLFPFAFLLS
jgi:hypothetical protein